MKLTDNEKRDVIKYLEAGKPLPEKYRFLLFEDAQEVELLWNGKTNEVTNLVLPFQVIDLSRYFAHSSTNSLTECCSPVAIT